MIAVLCTALPDIGAGTATPAIALVAKAMPDVNKSLIQMIVSIPSVCLIFFPPVYAALTRYVKKKKLLLLAFILMLAGSIGPTIFNDIYLILACRFIMGCGNGIIMPITIDLIIDMYERHERQSMLGYAAAVTSIGGILFQVLGGVMGSINWHYCFLATCVSVPCYLFALIFLPDVPIPVSDEGSRKFEVRKCMKPSLLFLGGFMIVWEMMYFVFLTNISLYLVNAGIANAAQVGVITSTVTVGGMIMSVLYGPIVRVFHEKVLPFAYLVTACGFLVICLGHTALVMGMGALLIGIGYGISAPCQLNLASNLIPREYASVATSVCYTARGIGGFVSPLVITAVCAAVGTAQEVFPFRLAAGVLAVFGVLMIVYLRKMRIKINT